MNGVGLRVNQFYSAREKSHSAGLFDLGDVVYQEHETMQSDILMMTWSNRNVD